MKNQHFVLLTISLLILFFTEFSYSQLTTENGYIYFRDQILQGNNDGAFTFKSNNSDIMRLAFTDKENDLYGQVYGNGNGNNFGLLDGDANWSYLAVKDQHTVFRINNIDMMRIKANGNIGIGTSTPEYKLDVCGIGRFKEVLVEDGWCDFVFEPEYCLTTLEEEAEFIKLYGHLSNFESAEEMDGMINVNDIFKRQQIQIEENVLHLIEMNEENEVLQIQVDDLTDEVNQLNEKVSTLTVNYEALAKELAAIKKQLR